MELMNLTVYIIGLIVFLLIIAAILTRLRKIVNTTYRINSHPVVRHYAEGRIFEMTGDNTEALREYYRAYVAFNSLRYKWVAATGGKITAKSLEEKIKQLGGDPPVLIMKPENKSVV